MGLAIFMVRIVENGDGGQERSEITFKRKPLSHEHIPFTPASTDKIPRHPAPISPTRPQPMKSAGGLFEKIAEPHNLRLAFLKAIQGKSRHTEAQAFRANRPENLRALQ